jgi:ABC-type phosphate/phosphonate transport system substrate-binding protein
MYDLPEVSSHTDALWSAIADRLVAGGIDAPKSLFRAIDDLHAHWLDPNLLFSQACGYPAVAFLDRRVSILGSWSTTVDEGEPGWYRSVVVARDDAAHLDLGTWFESGVRFGANDPDSLSGWWSLGGFLSTANLGGVVQNGRSTVLFTGAHANTLTALARSDIDMACIDAWTLSLLQRWRPTSVPKLRIVGRGPSIAVTPLITSLTSPAGMVDVLRAAVADVCADPSVGVHLAALGINGFVTHGIESHDPVRVLVDQVQSILASIRVMNR